MGELHFVLVFGVLGQSDFRAELGTAFRARELSCTLGSPNADRLHHGASNGHNGAQDSQA